MCLRYGGPSGYMPKWYVAGYRPKQQCDKCGHKSEYKEHFRVFHIDTNLNNCKFDNLKTVCANCISVLSKEGIKWKQGDLTADY